MICIKITGEGVDLQREFTSQNQATKWLRQIQRARKAERESIPKNPYKHRKYKELTPLTVNIINT